MQTIRIYARSGGIVAQFTGAAGLVETEAMRAAYPEGSRFLWLR